MKAMIGSLFLGAAGLLGAAPQVTGVTLAERGDELVVSYVLSEEAIVVVDIQTNAAADVYASIGGRHQWTLDGDVNKVVKEGGRSFTWTPCVDLPEQDVDAAKIKIVFHAYAYGDAPDYMVVNLATASVDKVSFYPDVDSLPGGLLTDGAYRTSKMAFRHIPAKNVTWVMGVVGEHARDSDEKAHRVTLTNDYWMAVFECTQAQAFRFNGERRGLTPHRNSSYNNVRGNTQTYSWPFKPSAGSIVGGFRAATGHPIDLPGEAQWEYACRAGNGEGFWNDGSAIQHFSANSKTDSNLDNLATFGYAWSLDGTYTIVGSHKPNSWGLYDMHGNVSEMCLDWRVDDITANMLGEVVSKGAYLLDGVMAGKNKIVRGGNYSSTPKYCRSSERYSYEPESNKNEAGFRFCSVYWFQEEQLLDPGE